MHLNIHQGWTGKHVFLLLEWIHRSWKLCQNEPISPQTFWLLVWPNHQFITFLIKFSFLHYIFFFKLLERRTSFTYYEFLYPAHFNGNNTKYWVKSQWLFFCNLFFHPTSCNRSASVSSVFISSLPHSQTEDPRAQLIALKWLTSREKMSTLQRTWTGSTFYVCYVSLLLFLTVLSLTLILL